MYWYNTKYILSILYKRNKESKQEGIHEINGTFLQQLQEIWTITQNAGNLRYYYEIYTNLSLSKLKINSCLAMNVVLNSLNKITQPHNTGRQVVQCWWVLCVYTDCFLFVERFNYSNTKKFIIIKLLLSSSISNITSDLCHFNN